MPDTKDDITIEILRDIRDDVRDIRDEVKNTNTRLDQMGEDLNCRLDQMGEDLNTRIDQTNERLDHTNLGLAALRQEAEEGFNLMDQRFDNLLLGEHGKDREDLRRRMDRVEERLGLTSG